MRFWVAILVALSMCCGCHKETDPKKAGYWIERLDSKSERLDAIKELGKLGDKAATPGLLEWLSKEGDWQAEAAYALGQIGDASAVPALLKTLVSGSRAVPLSGTPVQAAGSARSYDEDRRL